MQKLYAVADETFVLPSCFPLPGVGILYMNAAVIRAAEPVLVDTGAPLFRDEYLEAAFSLVDPDDVRWIYLSHDDRDHSGNVMHLLERCPNAQVVTNAVGSGRMSEEFHLPMNRVRWVNDGEAWSAGDRTFTAVRPPLFDSPATRGLWDPKTGVYFASDCFGAAVPTACQEIGDLPRDAWEQGFAWFNRVNHPWHELVDPAKFARALDRVRRLEPRAIVSYHGPHARGRCEDLLQLAARVAEMAPPALPTHADLELMLAGAPSGAPTVA
jgi:flavorubredoxin